GRLQGAHQDKTLRAGTFDENIEKPVHPVIQVHVSGPRRILGHKFAGRRPEKRVASLVSNRLVSLHLHDPPRRAMPKKFRADQAHRRFAGILLEKLAGKETGVHTWEKPGHGIWTPR